MATLFACERPGEKDMARGIVKPLRRRQAGAAGRARSNDSLKRLTDFARRLVAVPHSAVVESAPSSSRKRSAPVRMPSRHKKPHRSH